MTYKKFYFGKLNAQILKKIDAEHKTKMKQLIKEINQGSWTEKQKKRQKRSIISNIALYLFMKKGMSGDEIWKSRILSDDGEYYRVDVLKCLWADTCNFFECPELCEIFCLCDHIVFGNIKGFVFERSQTLGMNGEKCDFCFINRKGES